MRPIRRLTKHRHHRLDVALYAQPGCAARANKCLAAHEPAEGALEPEDRGLLVAHAQLSEEHVCAASAIALSDERLSVEHSLRFDSEHVAPVVDVGQRRAHVALRRDATMAAAMSQYTRRARLATRTRDLDTSTNHQVARYMYHASLHGLYAHHTCGVTRGAILLTD